MILDGFEIENWGCIRRPAVADLPRTGVVVLHGPNGTGKSSVIEALRACLMDRPSSSKALGRGLPKNTSEKPRVSVEFRARGTSWRIAKRFASKHGTLESRAPGGAWKLETDDATEAHRRSRELCGGGDSSLGLHQLLWLTQAQYALPKPKDFDGDVQARLRAVLGVLQTPLDDRFLTTVKGRWSEWFSARNKPGERPKLKQGCSLDKDLERLRKHEAELSEVEARFDQVEAKIARSNTIEVLLRDLGRQLRDKAAHRDRLQKESDDCEARLLENRSAAENLERCEEAMRTLRARKEARTKAETRVREEEASEANADRTAKARVVELKAAEARLREHRREVKSLQESGRVLQEKWNDLNKDSARLTLAKDHATATATLGRAEQADLRVKELEALDRDRPAPDARSLKVLEENRQSAERSRSELAAAAFALTLRPEPGAGPVEVRADGDPESSSSSPTGDPALEYAIRRRAEVAIAGWGRLEIVRGTDTRTLDDIEDGLRVLDRRYDELLAPFGLAAGNPNALDQLRKATAEAALRAPERDRLRVEVTTLAPNGTEILRAKADDLARRLRAANFDAEPKTTEAGPTLGPAQTEEAIERSKQDIEGQQAKIATEIAALDESISGLDQQIEGRPATKRGARPVGAPESETGLREQASAASLRLAGITATLETLRKELDRLTSADQTEADIRGAEAALETARKARDAAGLSEDELTVGGRLEAARDGWSGLDATRLTLEHERLELRGALSQSEGLHQERAAAAARVEEARRRTARETLESHAYDRLYALFEECRQKQLSAIMGPIHDRVVRWMRLLRIGGYQRIDFNDQFLPETLIAGDGAIELPLADESIGTIEQIALMVRLALGSSLSTPEEPVAAVLDDPLTHSDVERLELMRHVLKSAAAGDAPRAGPLQILVFTCHPEWFAAGGARNIDLAAQMR